MEVHFKRKICLLVVLIVFCTSASSHPGRRKDSSSSSESEQTDSTTNSNKTLQILNNYSRRNESQTQNNRRKFRSSKENVPNRLRHQSEDDITTSSSDSTDEDSSDDKNNSKSVERKQFRSKELIGRNISATIEQSKKHKNKENKFRRNTKLPTSKPDVITEIMTTAIPLTTVSTIKQISTSPKSIVNSTTELEREIKQKTFVIRRKVVKIDVDPRRINIRPASTSVVIVGSGNSKSQRVPGFQIITPSNSVVTTTIPTTTTAKMTSTPTPKPKTSTINPTSAKPTIAKTTSTKTTPIKTTLARYTHAKSTTTIKPFINAPKTTATTDKNEFNIDKYTSPEFHDINNVYTQPISPEIAQFIQDDEPERVLISTDNPRSLSEILDLRFKNISEGIIRNITQGTLTGTTEEVTTELSSSFAKNVHEYLRRQNDNKTKITYKNSQEVEIKKTKNPLSTLQELTNESKINLFVDSLVVSTSSPVVLSLGTRKHKKSTTPKTLLASETINATTLVNEVVTKYPGDELTTNNLQVIKLSAIENKTDSASNATRGNGRKMAYNPFKPRVRISLKNKEGDTTQPPPSTTDEVEKVKFVQLVKMHPYTRRRPVLSTQAYSQLDPISESYVTPVKSATAGDNDDREINLRKRGSVKFSNAATTSLKKKEESPADTPLPIPPTATAWAFATLNRAPVPMRRPSDNATEVSAQPTIVIGAEEDLQKIDRLETTADASSNKNNKNSISSTAGITHEKTSTIAEDNKLVSTETISDGTVKLEVVPTIRIPSMTTPEVPLEVIGLEITTASKESLTLDNTLKDDTTKFTSTITEIDFTSESTPVTESNIVSFKTSSAPEVTTNPSNFIETDSTNHTVTTEVSLKLDVTPSNNSFESITKLPSSITTPSNDNIKSAVYDLDFIDAEHTTQSELESINDNANDPNYYDSSSNDFSTTTQKSEVVNWGVYSNDLSHVSSPKTFHTTTKTSTTSESDVSPHPITEKFPQTTTENSQIKFLIPLTTNLPVISFDKSPINTSTYEGNPLTTKIFTSSTEKTDYPSTRPPVTGIVEILNFSTSTEDNRLSYESNNFSESYEDFNSTFKIITSTITSITDEQFESDGLDLTSDFEDGNESIDSSTMPNSISSEDVSDAKFRVNIESTSVKSSTEHTTRVETPINATETLLQSPTTSFVTFAAPVASPTTTVAVDTTVSARGNTTEWHYVTLTTPLVKESVVTDSPSEEEGGKDTDVVTDISTEYNITQGQTTDTYLGEPGNNNEARDPNGTEILKASIEGSNENVELIKVSIEKDKKIDIIMEHTTHYQIVNDEEQKIEDDSITAAVIISCIGVVALLGLVALLVVRVRRHRLGARFAQRCTPAALDTCSLDSAANGSRKARSASKRSYGNPAYDDEVVTSHPMHVAALASFAMDEESMSSEFAEIPTITVKADEVPQGCENKNRYVNVLPPPETRVPLSRIGDDPATEYINANYVTGPGNEKNYYIITQSPMSNTVADFWRMVWEQNSRLILMLTEYMENGVEKCYEYIPPSEASDNRRAFSHFHVILKKKETRDKYVVSTLQLKNTRTGTWREVIHMWYFWPAKGVPQDFESIINFIVESRNYHKVVQSAKEFEEEGVESNVGDSRTELYPREKGANVYSPQRAEERARNGGSHGALGARGANGSQASRRPSRPTLVHCAGGAGRSAALAVAARCCRELDAGGAADVPRAALRLRRDRPPAVQNKHQYIFVYKVLNEYAKKLSGNLDMV